MEEMIHETRSPLVQRMLVLPIFICFGVFACGVLAFLWLTDRKLFGKL